ncbi:hypothetical protein [Candidatus Profftia tarda]|uniref:Uncharacterized protein n=1 Tax=Candidatus Profftia tarda TaxID=1177216 RepID=A0A8E4EYA3_9ENTR|nr:hypothetical protein [Candidatus Profftia tarda]CAD6509491.1 hypothetical protein PROFFT_A_02670 [Candidatus Profftia tarda]
MTRRTPIGEDQEEINKILKLTFNDDVRLIFLKYLEQKIGDEQVTDKSTIT